MDFGRFIAGHFKALGVLFMIYAVLWGLAMFFGDNPLGVNIPYIVVTLWLVHSVTAFKVVNVREQGVHMLWGKILEELGSGPVTAPWPSHIETAPSTQIKVDFGTIKPEDRAKIESARSSDSWFVMEQPIRITWADINTVEMTDAERKMYKDSGLTGTITSDPHLYFIVRIISLRAVIEEVGSVEEMLDRIIDTCISALSEKSGKIPVVKANKELDSLNELLRERVEKLVFDPQGIRRLQDEGKPVGKSWGVDILEVRIKDLGFSKTVNQALVERASTIAIAEAEAIKAVIQSRATAEASVNTGMAQAQLKERNAEADLVVAMKKAEGDEESLRRQGKGQADALKAKGDVLTDSPGVSLIIQVDALSNAMAKSNVTILPMDMGALTSLVGAAESLKQVVAPKAKPEKN